MPLINVSVSRIINGIAELSIGNSHSIKIPARFMPCKIKPGDAAIIETMLPEQYRSRQKDIAKAILLEILGNSEGDSGGRNKITTKK